MSDKENATENNDQSKLEDAINSPANILLAQTTQLAEDPASEAPKTNNDEKTEDQAKKEGEEGNPDQELSDSNIISDNQFQDENEEEHKIEQTTEALSILTNKSDDKGVQSGENAETESKEVANQDAENKETENPEEKAENTETKEDENAENKAENENPEAENKDEKKDDTENKENENAEEKQPENENAEEKPPANENPEEKSADAENAEEKKPEAEAENPEEKSADTENADEKKPEAEAVNPEETKAETEAENLEEKKENAEAKENENPPDQTDGEAKSAAENKSENQEGILEAAAGLISNSLATGEKVETQKEEEEAESNPPNAEQNEQNEQTEQSEQVENEEEPGQVDQTVQTEEVDEQPPNPPSTPRSARSPRSARPMGRTQSIFQTQQNNYPQEDVEKVAQQFLKNEKVTVDDPGIMGPVITNLYDKRDSYLQENQFNDYLTSEKAIESAKAYQIDSLKKISQNQYQNEVKTKKEYVEQDYSEFQQEMKKKENELEEKLQKMQQAMKQRQQQELEQNDKEWQSETKMRQYNRSSQRLRVLRTQQQLLINAKRFDEAQQVAKAADRLKAQETAENHKQMNNDYLKARNAILERHENEKNAMQLTIETKRGDFQYLKEMAAQKYLNRLKYLNTEEEVGKDADRVWLLKHRNDLDTTTQRGAKKSKAKNRTANISDFNTLPLPPVDIVQTSKPAAPKKE